MKAIALVIVHSGFADIAAPEHVDVRVIDQDNIEAGDAPPEIPRGIGFEHELDRSGMEEGKDYTWEDRRISGERRVKSVDAGAYLRRVRQRRT